MLDPDLETKMHKKQLQQTRLIAASGVPATLLFGCGGSPGSTARATQGPLFAARVKAALSTTWSTGLFGGG